MATKCWEHKTCGREPGGANVDEMGVCPCFPDHGRECWLVAGTLCGGTLQGSFAEKLGSCTECDFFHKVMEEEE